MSAHTSSASVRVRYAETDKMGYAYYAHYLTWFEVGRCEWLRTQGWTYREMEDEDGTMLPVIEAHCEYRQPARYDDAIEILTSGELVTPVRLKFLYEVIRLADGVTTAVGHTVHAATDLKGRPKRLPTRVRVLFA